MAQGYGTRVELVTSAELIEFAQNNFGNTRSGSLAGPIGGFLIAALVVTTILLIRNMNARLRRLPERFPPPRPEVGATPGVEPDSGESTEQTYRKRAE